MYVIFLSFLKCKFYGCICFVKLVRCSCKLIRGKLFKNYRVIVIEFVNKFWEYDIMWYYVKFIVVKKIFLDFCNWKLYSIDM